MIKTKGYAALKEKALLEPFSFERRNLGDYDVQIEILYCGVCHTDINMLKNEWGSSKYPMVPGHEIVGKVSHIGKKVTQFKINDLVLPSNIIDCCGTCTACLKYEEQYCQNDVFMYNTPDKYLGGINYGGFAKEIIINEKFIAHIPEELLVYNLSSIAPLICAGITTYSALKHWKISKGQKVGIIGIGGLGHLAVKFAHAMGAHVVTITTTPDKQSDAKRLGAYETIISTNIFEMKKHFNSFDFLLNTIPVSHNLTSYLNLLKYDSTMCLLGRFDTAYDPIVPETLLKQRKSISGSVYGGSQEIKEMLNFCIEKNITADVQIIPIQEVNEAFKNVVNKKVRYRYVIDMTSLQ